MFQELKQSFKEGSYLTRLLYINVGVFVVVNLLIAIFTLTNVSTYWVSYLEVPASFHTFVVQPWSIITYMFLHTGFIHLLFNVLALYWFGKFFLTYYNQKQLTSLYFLGGLTGALVYMVGYNVFPYFKPVIDNSYLLGASASVMAILFAPVVTEPDREIHLTFIGNIKLKYLGLIFLLIDLLGVGATNAGGSMAHLGGAVAGCLFALIIKKNGVDICTPINKIIGFFANMRLNKPKMKVKSKREFTDAEWNEYNHKKKQDRNARVDEILEKIKKSGYENLTPEEKKELFEISK